MTPRRSSRSGQLRLTVCGSYTLCASAQREGCEDGMSEHRSISWVSAPNAHTGPESQKRPDGRCGSWRRFGQMLTKPDARSILLNSREDLTMFGLKTAARLRFLRQVVEENPGTEDIPRLSEEYGVTDRTIYRWLDHSASMIQSLSEAGLEIRKKPNGRRQ